MKFLLISFSLLSIGLFSQESKPMHDHSKMENMSSKHHSMSHTTAPIGVMGSMHHKGFMLSIKHGFMKMNGNILDGKNIDNSKILETPNPLGNMPANLSIIPQNMDMKMTMIDAMYTPSNNLTFMLMATYSSRDMKLNTYSPMMSRGFIGQLNTSSSDLSDISFSTLFRIRQTKNSGWHGEISFKKSIGKDNSMAQALTPMGKKMNMIMPYAMQPGDGSSSLVLGLTNTRDLKEGMIWGTQLKRKMVVSESSWSFGDQTEFNSWIQYPFSKHVSISSRFKFIDQDALSGSNPLIMAPVQTANPKNYGGAEAFLGLGININLDISPGGNDSIGIEILKPVNQNKNNLQMKTDYQVIIGYQKSF